jgi:Tol biopolymer transport system component
MSLTAGTKLGPYEVIASVGAGGMGEVYRARDTRLGRDVAIKILPPSVSDDPDRLRRFEQEARAAGSLNHPNILVVHDVGDHDRVPYVVCELLEGTTLREQLTGAPLPARRAIDYAIQIARGLAAAHERGIVHRDLKPENLFVTRDGRVKILDFGIAKLVEGDQAESADTPTEHAATDPGLVLGTVGYMSPEQVRGQRVDHRSDIFSFGAVLYEMLAGKRAFKRESSVETLNAILTDEPPELRAVAIVPALDRVVRHCLEKSPAQRFQSARDAAFALEGVTNHSGQTAVIVGAPPTWANRAWIGWLIAGFAVMTAAALAMMALRREGPDTRSVRFEIPAPDGGAFQGFLGVSSAISPDGKMLVMVVTTGQAPHLYLRPLDSTRSVRLGGTDGASGPFWSPDSQWIGFFADGKLKRVGVAEGAPQTICAVPGARATTPWMAGTWGIENTILFTGGDDSGARLLKVQASPGASPVAAVSPGGPPGGGALWPYFLPDGRTFLYYSLNPRTPNEVRIGSLESSETQAVMQGDSRAVYAEPGYVLFAREGTLMAQAFDLRSRRTSGEPTAIAEDLLYFRDLGQSDFSVSKNGVLAIQAGVTSSRLVWYKRDGTELSQVGDAANFNFLRLSPDAEKVAVGIFDRRAGTADIALFDLLRGAKPSYVTVDPIADWTPVFSPDGTQLAFASARAGAPHVHVKDLHSSTDATPIVPPSAAVQFVSDWSRDPEGPFIVYQDATPTTRIDLMRVALTGDRTPRPLVDTLFDDTDGVVSTDGKWLAYVSTESGRNEVYVRPIGTGTDRLPVSTAGGLTPRWRRDGRELYYLATASTMVFGATVPDGRLMAVTISPDGRPSVPTPLFSVRAVGSQFDTRDGQRFLVNVENRVASLPITVDLNWTTRLRR